jgi:transposase
MALSGPLSTHTARVSKKTVLPSEQQRARIQRRREQWRKYQGRIDPGRLVFLDETWVKTNMAPIRGWCDKGQRLRAHAPYGHWKTLTFLAALRSDRIEAPCLFDGPINKESFTEWVRCFLVPVLRPGDIVILDNLSSHKGKAVRALIRAAGARILFLPPYSPDLNPIEQAFAKLKAHLRKAAPRAIDAVTKSLGGILGCFTPQECANYLKNAGYASN